MSWLAGVDGCPKGWFRVCRESGTGEFAFHVLETVSDLLAMEPAPAVIAIDIPIGLPAAGSRECDLEARKVLGPRRNSVFPAPVREALCASTRLEASEITKRIDGRKVGAQAWAIVRKIREVDQVLSGSDVARQRIREVHPEVCFWAWNGRLPMQTAKRKPAGRAERLALAEAWLDRDILQRARGGHLKKDLADDDVLDAIAALWTAHRIAGRTAATLPAYSPRDETGLPMEIVF